MYDQPEYESEEDQCNRALVQLVDAGNAALNDLLKEANQEIQRLVEVANARIATWKQAAYCSWLLAVGLAFILGGLLLHPR